MFNQKEFLEGKLDELENAHKEVTKMKSSLLDLALDQFTYIFELDSQGIPLLETIGQEQKNDIIDSLQNDIIPLFEENRYTQGIEKAKKYLNLLQENLEK